MDFGNFLQLKCLVYLYFFTWFVRAENVWQNSFVYVICDMFIVLIVLLPATFKYARFFFPKNHLNKMEPNIRRKIRTEIYKLDLLN